MFDFFGSPAGYPSFARSQPFVIPGARPAQPVRCRCGSPFCSGYIENRQPKMTPRQTMNPFEVPISQVSPRSRRPVEKNLAPSRRQRSGVDERRQTLRRKVIATKTIQRWWRGKLAQRRARVQAEAQQKAEEQRNNAAVIITRAIRRAAACSAPQRILRSLKTLKAIKRSSAAMVEKYFDRVMQAPASGNKEFLYLEDFLIKVLIQLDAVDSCGAHEVRQARKALIRDTQAILDQMDAHKSAPEPMEVDSELGTNEDPESTDDELPPLVDDSDADEEYLSATESDEDNVVPLEELPGGDF